MRSSTLLAIALCAWLGAALGTAYELSPLWVFAAASAPLAARSALASALVAFVFGCGWAGMSLEGLSARQLPAGIHTLEGWVVSAPERIEPDMPWVPGAPLRYRVLLETEQARVKLVLREPIAPGTHVRVSGVLVRAEPKSWALGFDGRAADLRRGVSGTLTLASELLLEELPGARLVDWPAALRYQLGQRLGETRAAGIARALVLGDRSALRDKDERGLVAAGIVHVLSVSGLHVSAAALAITWLVQALLALLTPWVAFAPKRVAMPIAALCVLAYVVLSGAEVPALRSAIAGLATLAARAWGPRTDAPRMLALALLSLLFLAPEQSVEPAFVFSFATMLSLLVWLPRHSHRLAFAALLPALVAAPFSAWYFGAVSTAGIVTNALAIPFSSLMVLIGLAWLATGGTLDVLRELLLLQAEALRLVGEHTPEWTVIDAVLWPWELALGLICVWLVCARLPGRLLSLALFGLAFTAPLIMRMLSRDTIVSTLPVGQGDGHVIFLPGGRTLVIDAGGDHQGRSDPGRRVVRPFLLAWRVRALDALVLTHAHPDHMLGLVDLAQHFRVRAFAWNGQGELPSQLAGLPRVALAIPELTLVHPLGEPFFAELSLNDNSLVYVLRHRGRSMLLTGDAEALAEDLFMPSLGHIDVLKIGHHGSHTSTQAALLATTKPMHAVISAGPANAFGHPHRQTLERLAKLQVWRTDLQGLITVTLAHDGAVSVRAFR